MAKEKFQCSFITKANDDATSQRMQMQILLYSKDEGQHGFTAKTLEMATLKKISVGAA